MNNLLKTSAQAKACANIAYSLGCFDKELYERCCEEDDIIPTTLTTLIKLGVVKQVAEDTFETTLEHYI